MKDRFRELIAKVRRDGIGAFPGKAARYAGDALSARVALRDCDAVGAGVRAFGGRPIVKNQGRIEVGSRVRITSRWVPVELSAGPGATLTIGDGVGINYGTLVDARAKVTIGDGVMIGSHCTIADSDVPGAPPSSEAPAREIHIGARAWLAVRVTVLPGARIGEGAVITAGSVVSGDIPPGVVAGGIPARVLRGDVGKKAPAPTVNGKATPAQAPREIAHRGTLISDFTINDLASELLSTGDGAAAEADVAPFGQVVQALLAGPRKGYEDFAVVWTRPEGSIPSFSRVQGGEQVSLGELRAEVDAFADTIARGAMGYRAVFVPTWTEPPFERGLGLLDLREAGRARALLAMNQRLAEKLEAEKSVYVLDAQRWISLAGKNAFSPKSWHLGKIPFQTAVFSEAAKDVLSALAAVSGKTRKLLVLDLDDTLWGGIVGDVGWENLRLGGHDGVGESFVEFQRAIKSLSRRGIVLAIVSKNEEATALEAIRKHPEMVLREDDFVAWRINWRDKAANVLEIVKELNLGMQSVVFIDDNPVERARVREALPEAYVPEWPEDKHQYASALAGLRCFDVAAITKEDAERTALYAAERKRGELQASVGNLDEWLMSLGIKVKVEPLGASNLQRTAQLLNKTNQLNLSTRRLTEAELGEWAKHPSRRLWSVSVSDRFGDAGLTGIVSVELEGASASIVDFVLSCRVMGRKVEASMVHVAVEHARKHGAERVVARYKKTAKNKPTLDFWTASGFSSEDGDLFVWNAKETYALPAPIALEGAP